MEPMNDEDDTLLLVNNKIYDAELNGDGSDQVWNSNQNDHDNSGSSNGDPLDIIIHVASRLEKLFRCGTYNAYVKKQVEFERSSPDGILPMEMQMYHTFLWEE